MHTILQNKHTGVTTHSLEVQLKQLFNYKQQEKEKGCFKTVRRVKAVGSMEKHQEK